MSGPEEVVEMMSSPLTRGQGPFTTYLGQVRSAIDDQILSAISDPTYREWLSPSLQELFARGKRLRGALLLLTFSAFTVDSSRFKNALELAAAIEIAHTASIVLDDMIDGDEDRRGKSAIHLADGQRQAVLGMVGTLSIPYTMVNRHGRTYTELLASTHRTMVGGEMAELRPTPDDLREHYDSIIARKTGQLFSLAARFGGMAAGCGPERIERLAQYGMLVGVVVQQADDICDLEGEDGKRAPAHGSEVLLARLIDHLPNTGEGESDRRESAFALLETRIDKAALMADKVLAAGGDEQRSHELAACLRSAPEEMALMMMGTGAARENVIFGRPLKRPK